MGKFFYLRKADQSSAQQYVADEQYPFQMRAGLARSNKNCTRYRANACKAVDITESCGPTLENHLGKHRQYGVIRQHQ